MKRTTFWIFSIFSIILLAITKSHSAYANDGLMIDEMLDAIAIHNVEIPYDILDTTSINTKDRVIEKELAEFDYLAQEEIEESVKVEEETEESVKAQEEIEEVIKVQEKGEEAVKAQEKITEEIAEHAAANEKSEEYYNNKITVGGSDGLTQEPRLEGEGTISGGGSNQGIGDDTLDGQCDLGDFVEKNQKYTVTFNTDGGENIQPIRVSKGNSIEELPVPNKTGYKFGGWYGGEFYVIDPENSSYEQGCNSPELKDASKYCILSLLVEERAEETAEETAEMAVEVEERAVETVKEKAVEKSMKRSRGQKNNTMKIYVSPFNLEIVGSACMGEQYCHNLNIGGVLWGLPVSYFGKLKAEGLLDSYTFGENYNMFRKKITNSTSLIYNLTAQGSEKSNHYRGQYMNVNKSNNCNISGDCGKEDSTKNLSIRCINVSNTELNFGHVDGTMGAVRYNGGPIIQDTTLYAKRDGCDEGYIEDLGECVEGINVIFDAETNGGKTTADPITVLNGTTIDLSEFKAVKSGYNFIGWNTNPNAKEKLDDNYVVEKGETLYAIFSKVMYGIFNRTLTVLYSQGEGVESINKTFDTCEIFNNETSCNVEAPVITLKQGYKNGYWLSDQGNIINDGGNIELSDNIIYTATAQKTSNGQSGGGGKKGGDTTVQDTDSSKNQSKNQDMNNSKNTTDKQDNNYSKEFYDAYEFAYKNGITTKSTIKEAQMYGKLTRIEMAKMLSQYAINVLGRSPDVSLGSQNFIDVSNSMDEQYNYAVTLAYQLGIMGQNMKNNMFKPKSLVTRAEFTTALSRMLYGLDDGVYESTGKFYIPHISKLYNEGIIQERNPNLQERRGYIMLMLMRSIK